ncbi:hypothetical protein Amal_02978 [Acetobacter malorum]|uniref:Uncharacterized protein n=1 Tax=Acetobacter malorum TaxID=178901 RepID=A0A177G939_9PROT|nr:hypothetical protein Amal_02978 [Acetobacter malorum]
MQLDPRDFSSFPIARTILVIVGCGLLIYCFQYYLVLPPDSPRTCHAPCGSTDCRDAYSARNNLGLKKRPQTASLKIPGWRLRPFFITTLRAGLPASVSGFLHELGFQVHGPDTGDLAGNVMPVSAIRQTDALNLRAAFDHQ